MISLNIIPDEMKREIKLDEHYRFYKKVMLTIFVMLLFFSSSLYAARLYLKTQQTDTTEENTSIAKNTENYSKQIKEINLQLKEIKEIQNNDLNWVGFILNLSKLVNKDIRLSQITIDKETNTLKIIGKAGTRDGLLLLKSALEETMRFDSIVLPITSLLEKTDIIFEINTNITDYAIN